MLALFAAWSTPAPAEESEADTKWLRISKAGDGSGVVTSSPSGINCGSYCEADFNQGATVRLTATPSFGSVFGGWSGDCSGDSKTIEIRVQGNKECTASFYSDEPKSLFVVREGTGSGTVASQPSGINCGNDCNQTYAVGTNVKLTATASSGSLFKGWSGECVEGHHDDDKSGDDDLVTDPVISFRLWTHTTCVAHFASAQEDATLVIEKIGSGSGRVTSSPLGIDCGSDCQQTYDVGTTVQLYASASAGSVFKEWGGDCSGTNSTISVGLFQSKTCTARFESDDLDAVLRVTKSGTGTGLVTSSPSGINCGSDCQQTYDVGTTVQLYATASAGSVFVGWSGDCSGTNPTISVAVFHDKTCNARFDLDEQDAVLFVTKTGTGTGLVTSSPSGINCGSDCQQTYDIGTTVQLYATASAGSVFVGWTGDCSGTNSTTSVAVFHDKTCNARFDLDEQDAVLFVTKTGTGTGLVTSSPSGINCGSDCQQTYDIGTTVQLYATPSAGSVFVGWSGDCSGTNPTISVALFHDKTCNARFDLDEQDAVLRVTKTGTGTGLVTSSPSGINCGSDCQQTYDVGTTVQLYATPSAGSVFVGWSGDCSGTNPTISVALFHDKTCNARFDLGDQDATLFVTKTGTGTGFVSSSPSGISCGSDCQQTYGTGTTVQLTATALAGSVFVGWSGDCSGTNSTISVALFHDKTCNARFDLEDDQDAVLRVTKTGTGTGLVTSSPSGINCGSDCQQTYGIGTTVQLTATASAGSVFVGWSGDCSGTNSTISVALFNDKTCNARFDLDDDQDAVLRVTKTGTGTGLVTSSPSGINCGSDCQQTYAIPTTVQLTATASAGSVFVGWSGDCSGTNSTFSVALFNDKTCNARFDLEGGGGCRAELSLENVGGSCEGDIEASLVLSDSSCILRGVQLTIDDVPNWVELVACEKGSTLHSSFGCSINDDGDKASLFIVSTSGGQIPIGVQPRELARLTFRGTDACNDDCTTDVRLDLTVANVADQDNNPVSVLLNDASFSPCESECGTKGDVDCDHEACTLFDVLGAIDQALHDSDTCEADVFQCDSTVDLFDVVCLIDCALDRPSHCLSDGECNDSTLPSGCDDKSRVGGGAGSATLTLDYDSAPLGPGTLDVRVEKADRPVRGLALTFQIPAEWNVAQVRTVNTPDSFSAKFHQSGQTLRVLLLSDFAELLPTDVAAGVQIQFTRGRQISRERQQPVLVSAEAADADRVPIDLTVRHD